MEAAPHAIKSPCYIMPTSGEDRGTESRCGRNCAIFTQEEGQAEQDSKLGHALEAHR